MEIAIFYFIQSMTCEKIPTPANSLFVCCVGQL